MIDFIQSNLTSDLSLAIIAQQFGLSQATLIDSFKHELNQTPHNFILAAKLKYSAILLKTTLLTLAEIAPIPSLPGMPQEVRRGNPPGATK